MAGVIIAPHADDELIGCYSKIINREILYSYYVAECDEIRRAEAVTLCSAFGITPFFLNGQVLMLTDILRGIEAIELYIPSPNDNHNLHKLIYYLVYHLRLTVPIIVYSVYMNDFFIRPISNHEQKRIDLDHYYPSQKALWKHDARYYLFEGYAELR